MSNSPYYYQPDNAPKSKRGSGGGGGGGGGRGSSKILKIVLIVVLVLVLLCVGAGVVVTYLLRSVVNYSSTAIATVAVEQSPEAKDVIGDVTSAELNTTESNLRADGSVVITVHGTKGEAKIIISPDKENAKIDLPNGQSIPIKAADIKNAYKKE